MKCPHCNKVPIFWYDHVESEDFWDRETPFWYTVKCPGRMEVTFFLPNETRFFECSDCGGVVS